MLPFFLLFSSSRGRYFDGYLHALERNIQTSVLLLLIHHFSNVSCLLFCGKTNATSEYDADFYLAKTTTNDIQSTQMNHVTGENGGRVATYYMFDVTCHPQHDVDPPKTNMTTSTRNTTMMS
jgi:hypothetical protein